MATNILRREKLDSRRNVENGQQDQSKENLYVTRNLLA
jgi:hypothetical protein